MKNSGKSDMIETVLGVFVLIGVLTVLLPYLVKIPNATSDLTNLVNAFIVLLVIAMIAKIFGSK